MIFYIQIVHGRLQTQSFLRFNMIEVQLRVLCKLLFQIKQLAWCLAWSCCGCGGAGGGCWGGGCGGVTWHGCFHFFFFRVGATGKFAQITRGATEKSSHGADSATQARDEETTERAGDGQLQWKTKSASIKSTESTLPLGRPWPGCCSQCSSWMQGWGWGYQRPCCRIRTPRSRGTPCESSDRARKQTWSFACLAWGELCWMSGEQCSQHCMTRTEQMQGSPQGVFLLQFQLGRID